MTKLTIEIHYSTGNSFGRYEETEQIGWEFDTLDEAKQALQCIKEHHKFYHELNSYEARRNGGRQAVKDRYKDRVWYDHEYPEHRFKFGDRCISTFWTGYFETLHHAKIVFVEKHLDPHIYYGSEVNRT